MLAIFFLQLIWSSISAQVTSLNCQSFAYNSVYKFNSSGIISKSPTCDNYYKAFGSCINPEETNVTLSNFSAIYKFNGVNAFQYAQIFTNMSIYWQANNGFINGAISSTNTLSKSLQVTWSSKGNYTSYLPAWVLNIQKNALNSISTCFSNYVNITIGLWCGMTSNKPLENLNTIQFQYFPYSFAANLTNVGGALMPCLPLLDLYCSMSYGVSISNSGLPFNRTFNLSDNYVPLSVCNSLQSVANCTSVSCMTQTYNILMSLYNTNRMFFVPDFSSLNNLAKFMVSGKDPASFTALSTPSNIPMGAKLYVSAVNTGENFYNAEQASKFNSIVYGEVNSGSILFVGYSLFFLMIFRLV